MEVCLDPCYNIICHTLFPEESNIRQMKQFQGMSFFRIFHSDVCRNLLVDMERNGKNTQDCCIII